MATADAAPQIPAPLRPEALSPCWSRTPRAEWMRFRARHPWDPSLAGWAGVGGPHLLWGGMGGALPGLQLLAPRTDKGLRCNSWPGGLGARRAQSPGSPHRGSVTVAADAGGGEEEKKRGTKGSPRPSSSHQPPSLPDPMWPRQPSYSPFGAASCVTTPQLFPDALCSGQGTLACLGSPPLAPRTECNGGCCCSNWAMPIAQQVCEGPRRKRLQGG